jgi:hypothetical protein
MAMPDEQRNTATGTNGAAWLSVARASQIAGISKRAMQKRAALGQIGARKTGDGSAARWEIDGRELSANLTANSGANCEPIGREPRTDERPKLRTLDAVKRESGREPRTGTRELSANSTANREPVGRELSPEREAELKSEIAFLRGLVESLSQSEAQTKAALREALKAMPKQLTTGTPAPTAATPTATAGTDSHGDAIAMPQAPDARESPTYDDIADEIERRLNQ